MYASVNRVNIGSNNGLSPGRRQAIILTNAGILLMGPLGIKIRGVFFNQRNAFENVVCEMAAILSKERWAEGLSL